MKQTKGSSAQSLMEVLASLARPTQPPWAATPFGGYSGVGGVRDAVWSP
jgi:hypothetical protein